MLLMFLGHVSPMEWMIVFGLVMLAFGRRLPELGRPLGKGVAEFKRAVEDLAPGIPPEGILVASGLVLVLLSIAAWAAVMSSLLGR